ncbi:YfgM family protein [Parashewanella tropica]|uniref:YfgM family protein n=1 Tax=Parashewanella tropica TaxID=2547970 RepID=UPI00105A1442|nr:tetratricopeptide repeat protein [Parashewanella tropica]
MEIYSSEEQQVEAIKRFWKEYGNSIIIGAVVGLGGLYGWNYYSDHKVGQAQNASNAYQAAVKDASDQAKFAGDIANFKKEYDQKGYQAMLQLQLAKSAVAVGEYDKAATALKSVISAKPGYGFEEVATIRLARIQAEQGLVSEALTTLSQVTNEAFAPQRDELKGDLLVRQGDLKQAKEAYEAALAAEDNGNNPVLKMKLDNLTQA